MHNIKSVAIGIRNVNTKSGLGKILLEQVTDYLARGVDVVIYTSKYDKQIARTGVKIVKIMRIPFVGEYYQRLLFAKLAEKEILKAQHSLVIGHGDLIHQDIMFLHNLVEKAYVLTHGKKMSPLNNIAKIRRLILNKQKFKLLIANSNLMKNELITSFQVPADKIRVVYPGFDPKQFNREQHAIVRSQIRQTLSIDPSTLVIGFITSGDFKKRALDLFIEALHNLPEKIKYKVLLVGKDKNLPKFLELAKAYNLDNKFIIKEPIDAVEQYFHATDFTVHPAHFEEFGMVVQEAMACGVPVITSKLVGASELMIDQSTVMDTPNITDLTAQINKLASQPILREQLSISVQESVHKTSWEAYVKNLSVLIDPLFKDLKNNCD